MKQKKIVNSAFSQAYSRWFSEYERERLHRKKRKGSALIGFPEPPASPQSIANVIDQIGTKKALNILGVHRSTMARWLAGSAVIPRASWLLLVMMAEGRLPGMSEDWLDWRFEGDMLCQIGTNAHYTAREIAGWPFQIQHSQALSRRIQALEKEKAHLLRVGYFDAANDPLISVG